MSKLLILSEIDCSSFLNSIGIYPDEFYTDFMLFKNKAFTFVDADIIVMFAGSCHFSKRHVLETVKILQGRANNPGDTGVNSLTVITDIFLPSIHKYYKFQGRLSNISEYDGWKCIRKQSDIWDIIPRGNNTSKESYFFTKYDKGDVSKLRREFKALDSPDEALRGLIKKPDFSSISEI